MNCSWVRIVVAAVLFAGTAAAQNLSISGTVTDEKKAVVAGVKVVLRDPAGVPTEKSTDTGGEFQFDGLRSGSYEIAFSKEDYQSTSRTLTLTDQPKTVDVALGLGRISTTLDVTDSADRHAATRMYISDMEVPFQTSTVSQQTLREQNINDLATALENVSGVTVQVQYGSMEWYTINGFTQQSGTDFLMIDGMTSTGNRPNTQLMNIESVEVIKGPSALTLGSAGGGTNSAGGVINVTRKKPASLPQQELLYRVGRWGQQDFGASSQGTFFKFNKLLYRADLGTSNREGWRGSGGSRFSVAPAATYLINERGRVTLHQSFTRDRYTEDGGMPLALYNTTGFPLDRKFNPPGEFDLYRDWQTQVIFQYYLGKNIQFENQFFTQVKREQYLDSEGLTYNPTAFTLARNELYFASNRRPKQNYSTLRGTHSFLGMNHQWAVSFNYQDLYNWQDRSGPTPGSNPGSFPVLPILDLNAWLQPGFVDPGVIKTNYNRSLVQYTTVTNNNILFQDHIAFIQGRFSIDLQVGSAYSKRRGHNDIWDPATDTFVSRGPDLLPPPPGAKPPFPAGTAVPGQRATPFGAGATYFIMPSRLSVYFQASRSFNLLTAIPTNLDPSIDPATLQSPTSQKYGTGAKWLSQGGRLKAQIELGRSFAQNQFVGITNPDTGVTTQFQAGQQSSRYINFDTEGLVVWGIRATANYAYAACRYDSFPSTGGTNLSGRRCIYNTRHTGRAFLTKQVNVGGNSRLNFSIGATYRSKTPINTNQFFTYYGGWTRFDGAVGYEMSRKWSATVNIANLFDRDRYIVSRQGGNVYPGAPFAATLTLRYQFNHDNF